MDVGEGRRRGQAMPQVRGCVCEGAMRTSNAMAVWVSVRGLDMNKQCHGCVCGGWTWTAMPLTELSLGTQKPLFTL